MIARRGNIRTIYSESVSNFIRVEKEPKKAFKEMNDKKIQAFMQEFSGDWIKWKWNPPVASHMVGVWERQICSAWRILSLLLRTHGNTFDKESLLTLMVEMEGILNSRPLTVGTISDPTSELPLSPANILTMKSKVVMPPSGEFSKPDLFCRKKWRRIKHVINEFWSRWRKEFLQLLQERKKWQDKKQSFQNGDIVLLKDGDLIWNKWLMARVIEMFKDDNGDVRSVCLKVVQSKSNEVSTILEWPVMKILLLLEQEEVWFSNEEHQ